MKKKEKLKAKSLEYIRSHQEQQKEKKKQFYEENKQFCLDRLKKYREENREKYNALCLARYKIRCETDPNYQENLAKKRRERDLKNRATLIEEEVVLALTPETRGAPRNYGINKNKRVKARSQLK